jgi:hypothetical protein
MAARELVGTISAADGESVAAALGTSFSSMSSLPISLRSTVAVAMLIVVVDDFSRLAPANAAVSASRCNDEAGCDASVMPCATAARVRAEGEAQAAGLAVLLATSSLVAAVAAATAVGIAAARIAAAAVVGDMFAVFWAISATAPTPSTIAFAFTTRAASSITRSRLRASFASLAVLARSNMFACSIHVTAISAACFAARAARSEIELAALQAIVWKAGSASSSCIFI